MNTMNRCLSAPLPLRPRRATLLLAALCAAAALTGAPAAAQNTVPGSMGGMRNFPDAALRGTLVITAASEAELNGRTVRMAPGMRLFSPQNTLVMMHTVLGKPFTVNYLIENSTGMLLTAWILTNAEAAQKRTGSDGIQQNFRFESDATPAR
ncbi:MAG: hypothetical protein RBS27_11705 [Giesbergeria sp.]|jgi:hypothetical protein|nr:hypothetical protein [Giesbergeria sp.]